LVAACLDPAQAFSSGPFTRNRDVGLWSQEASVNRPGRAGTLELETREANLGLLTSQASAFLDERLPILKALQIE
jgi:hypothetical protein